MTGNGHGTARNGRYGPAVCAALAWCCLTAPAAAQTVAGTPVTNTATLAYSVDGAAAARSSNPVSLLVAERLDLTLALVAAARDDGGRQVIVRAVLTNTGTGTEGFLLDLRATGGTVVALAADSDGDGRLSDADERLTDRTAALAPGGALPLLAVIALAAEAPADAAITLAARAVTGAGSPGLAFAGRGDGGSDAVVGPTGAQASIATTALAAATAPRLIKTQSVAAPGGGSAPVAGAIITYSLEARFTGPASAARIDDDVPVGTRFVPGSIVVDGRPLSDAAGDDAASFDGARVSVALGDVAAATTRSIQFQAIIQ